MKSIQSYGLFLLVFTIVSLLGMPVLAAPQDAPGKGLNKSSKEINYAAAVEKRGYFIKFESDRIVLLVEDSKRNRRELSYLVADNVRTLYKDQLIPRNRINKIAGWSVLKLVIVDAVVVEIVLEEVPS